MNLTKTSKAIELLIESEKAKEALVEAFSQNEISDESKSHLLSMKEIVYFCEQKKRDISLVEMVISSLLENKKLVTEDVMQVLAILTDCQTVMRDFVTGKLHLNGPHSSKFTEYYSVISEHVMKEESIERTKRKELVKQQIFSISGLYIEKLAQVMQIKFGKKGFTYSSVWQYVNELSAEKEIITVGGPQGAYRYCFPNLSNVADRTRFYHKVQGYDGTIEKKVTDRFNLDRARKYWDIFLTNGVSIPILLVVDFGMLHNVEKCQIRLYGDYEPFQYFVQKEHVTTEDPSLNYDIYKARKIDRIVNGDEEEIWFDKEKADLSQYPLQIEEGAATYDRLPSSNS